MIPMTQNELDQVRAECYAMVKKRASLSAGTSAIPTPGIDIAADITILMELIPAINSKFGLAQDQIGKYDHQLKQIIYQVVKRAGLALIGQEITKTLVIQALRKIAGQTVAKQVLKLAPVVGWAANAAIGFVAMRYVGNSHVDDCYAVCKRALEINEQRLSFAEKKQF